MIKSENHDIRKLEKIQKRMTLYLSLSSFCWTMQLHMLLKLLLLKR